MANVFYRSLHTTTVNNNTLTLKNTTGRAASNKSDSDTSSIKNLASSVPYEDFDDSVSQVSRQSSDASTMLGTKSSMLSIVRTRMRDYSDATKRCDNTKTAVSNTSRLTVVENGASSVSNLDGARYDDLDDSGRAAMSPPPTNAAKSPSSSSSSHTLRDLSKPNDYETYLRTCNIAGMKTLRQPLASTISWISSVRNSTTTNRSSDDNESIVSSIVNLDEDERRRRPSTASLSTTTSTATISRRDKLAKLASTSVESTTNIVHNAKNKNIKYFGIPAGYAKNSLETFGGLSNRN